MTPRDADALEALHVEAVDRLAGDDRAGNTDRLLDRLDRLVREAKDGPTTQALAVCAHRSTGSVLRLNLAVADRVVLDPTFATRDLVRALQRTPRHLVLSLTSVQASLFEGADQLRPVPPQRFPVGRERDRRRSPSRPGLGCGRRPRGSRPDPQADFPQAGLTAASTTQLKIAKSSPIWWSASWGCRKCRSGFSS